MLYLVTGGSGSGKSEYAENLAVSRHRNESKYGRLIYVATMYPYFAGDGKMDSGTAGRIARHRNMRQVSDYICR